MKIPLVLLTGLLSNKQAWENQAHALDTLADITIISTSQNTPEKMVQDILQKAPPLFVLAGHSMGGWLCLEIMRTAPFRVQKLCLLNTTARMDSQEKQALRLNMIKQAEHGKFHEIVQSMLERFVYNPLVKADVEKMFLEVGAKAFINQEKAMLQRQQCFSILPKISCPTLVIHSAKDKIFSLEEHQELVSQIPGAKLAIVENSGHMSPMEAPQKITVLMKEWILNPL